MPQLSPAELKISQRDRRRRASDDAPAGSEKSMSSLGYLPLLLSKKVSYLQKGEELSPDLDVCRAFHVFTCCFSVSPESPGGSGRVENRCPLRPCRKILRTGARLELCLPEQFSPHSVVIRLVGGFTVTNQSFSGAVKPPTSDLWADCCGCHGFFGGQSASSDESQRRWHQASPAVWGP